MKALVLKGCGKNLGFGTLVGSLQRVPERPLQKVKLPLQWGHQGSEDAKTMKCSPRTVSHCRADLILWDKFICCGWQSQRSWAAQTLWRHDIFWPGALVCGSSEVERAGSEIWDVWVNSLLPWLSQGVWKGNLVWANWKQKVLKTRGISHLPGTWFGLLMSQWVD